MAKGRDLDARRRSLLASVLAGGAVYALPVVATLSVTNAAVAADSSDDGTPGRPEVPGDQGLGPEHRDGGRGRDSGLNPHFDDGVGASQSEDSGADASDYFDGIGKGGRGFA